MGTSKNCPNLMKTGRHPKSMPTVFALGRLQARTWAPSSVDNRGALMCRYLMLSLLCPLALLACGIEGFESLNDLHPPLALTASSSNSMIILSFLSFNDEEYFSGYNVFIGLDETEVLDRKTPLRNEKTETLPTFPYPAAAEARRITLAISKNTNGQPFAIGAEYYVGVTAYNSRYLTNSRSSNVTNVMIE
jgi:hypothetical protein